MTTRNGIEERSKADKEALHQREKFRLFHFYGNQAKKVPTSSLL